MNLKEHYDKMYSDAIGKIASGNYTPDSLIDSLSDNRRGITLIIRPDNKVIYSIRNFIKQIEKTEPQQYYYPDTDIHVTVMSIISCYSRFDISKISVPDYKKTIRKSIPEKIDNLEIEFRGVTASDSCIMVQGFVKDESLEKIRNNLRLNFSKSGLEQSLDKRYAIRTAHMTISRFRQKLIKTDEYLKLLKEYRNFYFGTIKADNMILVYNDWYHKEKNTKELSRFMI